MAEAERYDLAVIGAGPGGYVAAIRAAQLGMRVVCVDREAALGGTCLRIGCIPSKALLDSSELLWQARTRLATHGVSVGEVSLDLPTMMRRKDQVVQGLTTGVAGLFKKNGSRAARQRADRRARPRRDRGPGCGQRARRAHPHRHGSGPATLPGSSRRDPDRRSEEACRSTRCPHASVIGAGRSDSSWVGLGAPGSEVRVVEIADASSRAWTAS